MGLRELKPTSPGRRNTILPDFKEITKSRPEKSLLRQLRKSGGRNSAGRVSTRHRGGGARRQYRIIDFVRDQKRPGEVVSVEYDPNRSARIALVQYVDGAKAYILAPDGLMAISRSAILTAISPSAKISFSQFENVRMKNFKNRPKGGFLV